MKNEDKELQYIRELHRARTAKDIFDNEIFNEALKMLETEIIEMWKSAPLRDMEGQHKLKLMLFIKGKFEAYLKQIIETGKMAEFSLKDLEENKKRRFL